jgi:TonB family protein
MLVACVHTVTRYYVPDARNPRFDTDAALHAIDQYLAIQCPQRAADPKPDSGELRLTITTDTSGAVTQAELVRSSGDATLDGMFGAVAAQLKADSLRAGKKGLATRALTVGFTCTPNVTATLRLLHS